MKKILLVDDSVEVCKVMASVFSVMDGFEFSYVHSLDELKSFEFQNMTAILLDINLGRTAPSGIDCYNFLNEQTFSGKIIFFTGHASSNPLVLEAAKIPNVGILSKPASVEEIEAALS